MHIPTVLITQFVQIVAIRSVFSNSNWVTSWLSHVYAPLSLRTPLFSLAVQKRCEQYWPEKVGETLDPHNGLMVTLVSHIPFSDFIIRNLKLSKVTYMVYLPSLYHHSLITCSFTWCVYSFVDSFIICSQVHSLTTVFDRLNAPVFIS